MIPNASFLQAHPTIQDGRSLSLVRAKSQQSLYRRILKVMAQLGGKGANVSNLILGAAAAARKNSLFSAPGDFYCCPLLILSIPLKM